MPTTVSEKQERPDRPLADDPGTPAPVDKSAHRVRQMFGEIAPRYDFLNHLLSLNIDRYWRSKTVRRVRQHAAGPILDVCTGTGDLALAFAANCPSGSAIVAADFCHEMLVIGHEKAEKRSTSRRPTFIGADTMRLPLPSDSFQLVTVAFGLRNVQDTAAGLAEMTRVCRPGGCVAVLEFSKPAWQPFKGLYDFYFQNVLPRIGQLFARNRQQAYHYLPESVTAFPHGQALVELFEKAGLRDVTYEPLTLGIAGLYLGHK